VEAERDSSTWNSGLVDSGEVVDAVEGPRQDCREHEGVDDDGANASPNGDLPPSLKEILHHAAEE
jgi:hypothetical protein